MAKQLSVTEGTKTLGVASAHTKTGVLYADEFLPELKGNKAIKVYRQMRDNDSTVGASLYTVEQILRDVDFYAEPAIKGNKKAEEYAEWFNTVLDDMDHSLDDHVSEALSHLTYGFAVFEVTYKRRKGPKEQSRKNKSKYNDGTVGIRKISVRAPWTISKFDIDEEGEVQGFEQNTGWGFGGSKYLPLRKCLHYKTPTVNNDPSGRSILRNAYEDWYRLKNLKHFEAVGIERDLAGIPVGTLPADYFAEDAPEAYKAVKDSYEKVLTGLKKGEETAVLIPSDTYTDDQGKPSNVRLMGLELLSSTSTRSVDTDTIIRRYEHSIARSIMTEFLMLGSQGGSYALADSKTGIFQKSLESYITSIRDVLQKQLLERLWELNGFDFDLIPKIKTTQVVNYDLKDISGFLRNLNGAGINIADQVEMVGHLLGHIAEMEGFDKDIYLESRKRDIEIEDKRFTSDGVENAGGKPKDTEEEPPEEEPKDKEEDE